MEKSFLIFVVDDNELFLKVIKKKLADVTGAEVKIFSSGEDCLDHIDDLPDLVLSDYYLDANYSKKMNGDKLLEHIRRIRPEIPVIMYSSQESVEVAVSLVRQGALEYLPKDKNAIQRISLSAVRTLERLKNRYRHRERRRSLYLFLAGSCSFILFFFTIDVLNSDYLPDFNYAIIFIFSLLFGALVKVVYPFIRKISLRRRKQ